MSKTHVTYSLLLLGAAVAANCGGSSDAPASQGDAGMGPGGVGAVNEAGETSAAGMGGKAVSSGGMPASSAGQAGSPGSAGVPEPGGGAGGAAGAPAGGAGAGAGGASGAAGAGGAGICPASITDFPTVYAEAICQKRVACCTSDVDACMTEVKDALATLYPNLAQSETSGAAESDCAALEKCVAAVHTADCADWPKELGDVYGIPVNEPACLAIIKGKVAPTAACSSTYQCDHGYCATADANPTCVALVADGAACDGASKLCNLATSYCDADSKCAPRLANGVVCANDLQCQSRVCDTADTGKCVAPAADQCEFVPAGCSMSSGPVRGKAWPFLVGALLVGAALRRRRYLGC